MVDFSADYRLDDAEVYAQWYGRNMPIRQRLGKVVYGLPELFREEIPHGPAGGQPGLLSDLGDPGPGAVVEGRADRADERSSSTPRAACPGRAGRRS